VTFLQVYHDAVALGRLRADPGQARVAAALSALATRLRKPHGLSKLARLLKRSEPAACRGLYIHGDVGRGKSMLMHMFFEYVHGIAKHRVHFHAFMQDVHASRAVYRDEDVIGHIAGGLRGKAKLFCLDEMHITDIADAMIIGRLFEAMLERGVCLVTTSNAAPEDLYKDGLNRQLFLPFIARLRQNLDVIALDGPRDYRLGRMRARETFLHPATGANRVAFNAIWNDLTDSAPGRPESLAVLGRQVIVPKAAHACAAFTFAELCKEALGPPDYLAIAKAYHTVFVSGIEKLQAHQRNEARRFVLMIDTFYDAKTRLVALSAVPPEQIAPKGHHGLEFKRAVSRLKEMRSDSWWA
jgi:cell division protein ZapE